jgi:hypothetical protein
VQQNGKRYREVESKLLVLLKLGAVGLCDESRNKGLRLCNKDARAMEGRENPTHDATRSRRPMLEIAWDLPSTPLGKKPGPFEQSTQRVGIG